MGLVSLAPVRVAEIAFCKTAKATGFQPDPIRSTMTRSPLLDPQPGDREQELVTLTPDQERAFRRLDRAVKACRDSGIYFHQTLDTLYCLNGENVLCVDDTDIGGVWTEALSIPTVRTTSPWADDRHFVHFKAVEVKDA